ncbi:MAG: MFS transporter [Thermodesulfobacteriota bacterium]
MAQESMEPVGFRQWLGPQLLFTGIFFINFISRVAIAPLLPGMEADLSLTHAQAGSLFLFISLGYFVAIAGSGLVSQRLGHRGTVLLSALAVGAVMLALPLAPRRWGLTAGAVALGLASGLYLPSGLASLTSLVRPADWGKAMAVHELAPNLGFVAAPLLAELLQRSLGWRGVLGLLGGGALVLGLAFARWGRGGRFPGQAPSPSAVAALARRPQLWLMVALFSLGIGSSLGVFTMLPLYLTLERGWPAEQANLLLSLSRVSGLFMAFVAGWAYDRLGARRTLAMVLTAGGLATACLGLATQGWLTAALFLQPALAVCFFPAGFAVLSAAVPPEQRGLAVSLCSPPAFVLGGGALPALIGLLSEHYSFGLGIAVVGGLILAGAALTPLLRTDRGL